MNERMNKWKRWINNKETAKVGKSLCSSIEAMDHTSRARTIIIHKGTHKELLWWYKKKYKLPSYFPYGDVRKNKTIFIKYLWNINPTKYQPFSKIRDEPGRRALNILTSEERTFDQWWGRLGQEHVFLGQRPKPPSGQDDYCVDIYIMMQCLSVAKNYHFPLLSWAP